MDTMMFTILCLTILGVAFFFALSVSNRESRFDKFMKIKYPLMRWDLKDGENIIYEVRVYPQHYASNVYWDEHTEMKFGNVYWDGHTEMKFGKVKFDSDEMVFKVDDTVIYPHTKVQKLDKRMI